MRVVTKGWQRWPCRWRQRHFGKCCMFNSAQPFARPTPCPGAHQRHVRADQTDIRGHQSPAVHTSLICRGRNSSQTPRVNTTETALRTRHQLRSRQRHLSDKRTTPPRGLNDKECLQRSVLCRFVHPGDGTTSALLAPTRQVCPQ